MNRGRCGIGIVLLVHLLAAVPGLRAQDTLRLRYGVVGGYSANMHRADFRALPGVPSCCPEYGSGSGGGILGGLLAEFPISNGLLFGITGSYVAHDARLSVREPVVVIVNGTGRDGAFQHSVDATLSTIGLEPRLGVRLLDGLFANAGLRAGLYMARTYSQEERIVDPGDVGTYLDSRGADSHSRVRNVSSGTLPDAASFLLQGTLGLAWDLPLNSRRTLLLVPQVSYAFSFTNVVNGVEWKPDGLRAALALEYSPAPNPEKQVRYDTIVVRDTVTTETPIFPHERVMLSGRSLSDVRIETPETITIRTTIQEHYLHEVPAPPPMACTLSAMGVGEDGTAEPIATLKIEEFLSTVAHPLLNYVFFEPGSSDLPERYTRLDAATRSGFRTTNLHGTTTLPVYYNLLNIIGERMHEYPDAVLTLTGCNMDQGDEKGNIELSRKRAETVRDYLVRVWGVEPSRLQVIASNLPAKRSNPATVEGQAENRRVEIASTVPEVMDVVLINDTTRTSTPPVVRLIPHVESPRGVAFWEIAVMQHGIALKRFRGEGPVPESLDWNIDDDQASAPRYNEPVTMKLTADNGQGEHSSCVMELPTQVITLEQKLANQQGDFTIDRYNLILFSVGAAVISPANERIISLIHTRLRRESNLVIEGFADRTGNAASNQTLSAQRAKASADALHRPDAVTRGIGSSRLLYPNDLPEGRYYCRTVQILVKTPVQR
ncbi:MAG TPA: OmpA family protein [Candidatus Kapabacteria bacterium]|nr:OmpA family protein [Candidatus Kapabacteria bacterium]